MHERLERLLNQIKFFLKRKRQDIGTLTATSNNNNASTDLRRATGEIKVETECDFKLIHFFSSLDTFERHSARIEQCLCRSRRTSLELSNEKLRSASQTSRREQISRDQR